ncbi:MAG TPA: tetratricopeptide repeat protein [Nitrospirota bacterium]|nr:tetratricopeptide repeat protein [Nitrospirota bacterium]
MPTIKKRGSAAKKQPEQEIVTIAHKISAFVSSYKKQFTIAVSTLVAILLIIAGYWLKKSLDEQKAAPLVATAYEYYSPAAGANVDYGKALSLFREVQNKYPGTMSGAIAQYYIGNCLVNLDHPEEALREYQTVVTKYSNDKLLVGLAYQRMGYVYNSLGKQADAVKSFEQSESLMGPGTATVELARLYEASGNVPEAQNKYKSIAEKLAGTTWGMDAINKVQKIESVPNPPSGKNDK